MTEIIPAIIANNFAELKEKIELVEPYVKWVHIDVMDGNFVPNFTWNKPEELTHYDPGVYLEAHLMIQEPEKYVERWIDAGIKRIIFHIEATSDPKRAIKICMERGAEVGVAINPETPQSSLTLAPGQASLDIDMVLVMGVTPGAGGQEFKPEVLEKIRALRHLYPHLTIGVDGGMNPTTAKQAADAGANVIVAGSYIFKSDDIQKAISDLKNAIKNA
jgi:ribulose-phosphate 3-epimerase